MGTLRCLVIATATVVVASATTACGAMATYDDACYQTSMNSDYVAVMTPDLEQLLRAKGYDTSERCGIKTASSTDFPIKIGVCDGYYAQTLYAAGPDRSLVHIYRIDVENSTVDAQLRETLPTADELIAQNPSYADCA